MKINPCQPIRYSYSDRTRQTTAQPTFKANPYAKITDGLAGGISKLTDTKTFSNITHTLGKSKNYFPHLIAAESMWLSAFYIVGAFKNDKISEKQKKTEVLYQSLVTVFSAVGAYTLDNVVNKGIKNFSKTLKKCNPEMEAEKLDQAISGLKKLKSLVIFATIYRFIGPVILNPISNKISGYIENKHKNQPQENQDAPKETNEKK